MKGVLPEGAINHPISALQAEAYEKPLGSVVMVGCLSQRLLHKWTLFFDTIAQCGLSGMQFIQIPLGRVILNVFPYAVQFRFVTDNVLPVVALPQFYAGRTMKFVDAFGYGGFE